MHNHTKIFWGVGIVLMGLSIPSLPQAQPLSRLCTSPIFFAENQEACLPYCSIPVVLESNKVQCCWGPAHIQAPWAESCGKHY